MKRILCAFLVCCQIATLLAQGNTLQKGQNVPKFKISTAKGKSLNISELKGKVVMINFFATWCGPCKAELPVLQKNIWEKYKANDNFQLLVIGSGHSIEELNDFKGRTGLDLPFYPDEDKSVSAKFGTGSIPCNYIIDRNGKVVYSSTGYSPQGFQYLEQVLDMAIKNTLPDQEEIAKIVPFKFDRKYFQCENKWVVFNSASAIGKFPCGIVYLDQTAGFTVDIQGLIKVDNHKLVFEPRPNTMISKIRLNKSTNSCSILDDKWLDEWNLKKEPEWLDIYRISSPTRRDICFASNLNEVEEYEAALSILERIYTHSPHAEGLEFELIFAYNALRKFDKAIDIANDAIKNNPKNMIFYRELGYAYKGKGEYQKAIDIYTSTIEKCTDEQRGIKREIAINMAGIYQKQNDQASAQLWLEKAKEWAYQNPVGIDFSKIDSAYVDKDNRIIFKDDNLEQLVKKALHKDSLSAVYLSDVAHLRSLNISNGYKSEINKRIRNIDALKFFGDLEELFADFNVIRSIKVLSGLKKLRTISLSNNLVSNLTPLADLHNLEALNLYSNQVSDISPLAKLIKLRKINIFANRVRDISILSTMNELTDLNVGRNNITNISCLGNKPKLKSLWLYGNPVSNPEIIGSLNASLETLSLADCGIKDITFLQNCMQLKHLLIFDNQISNIEALKNHFRLKTLMIAQNKLSDLNIIIDLVRQNAFSGRKEFTYVLDVSDNMINYSQNNNKEAMDFLKSQINDCKF